LKFFRQSADSDAKSPGIPETIQFAGSKLGQNPLAVDFPSNQPSEPQISNDLNLKIHMKTRSSKGKFSFLTR
jgi:hypothetical protein